MDRREFLERVDAFGATRHWRMPSSGTAVTQRLAGGVNGGTLSGTIEYIAQSLAQEDSGGRTIGVANNGQMQIASASVFDAPAGCWLVLAQFDRVDFDEQQIVKLGSSAGGVDQLVFRRCTFSDTGDFGSGDVIGQQPAAGVDIEPNSESQGIYGLTMDTCTFSGNLGSVYNNGNTGGFSDGAGFLGQAKSTMRWLRLLDCTFTNNRKGLVLKATGNPVHSDTLVENVVVTGSTSSNNISLESAGGDGGTLVNWDIVNPKIGSAGTGAVTVEATLSVSGHSVDVRKGSFNPTISNPGGRSTFTLRNGLP